MISQQSVALFMRRQAQALRSRAIVLGLQFDLTADYLTHLWENQGGRCGYGGVALLVDSSDKARQCSVDRIAPHNGYLQGNVVLCCWALNACKGTMDRGEFELLLDEVARFRLTKQQGYMQTPSGP